ncbi:putative flavoprotein [Bipolaris maydis]|nr:putative flavoprotein [Bipolaris maydis]
MGSIPEANPFRNQVDEAASQGIGTSFVPKHLRIVMIGCGLAGIQFAHDVKTRLTNFELDLYEKNPKVGGTWYENRYPGCACDVPSHTYHFSWETNPRWTKFYSPSSEIQQYLEHVTEKHGLRQYMHFNHKVVEASWQESSSTWALVIEDGTDLSQPKLIKKECDIFVYGGGVLNNWKWPEIEGRDVFKGKIMHTAAWDESVDLSGKKVAVIGNSASAVQCVPAIQPSVEKVYNYMRTATWMIPHIFSDGKVQSEFPPEDVERFASDPQYYYEYRKELELRLASGFRGLFNGSPFRKILRDMTLEHMEKMVTDKKLLDVLIPKFEIGCRRFSPGDHYLKALQQPNVEVITSPIVRFSEHGIVTQDGETTEVDVIICATGFDTTYKPRFPIIGRDGYNLDENFGNLDLTESYLGLSVARFPNFFGFSFPNFPVLGSAPPGYELASDYILRVIDRIQTDKLKSVCIKESSQTELNKWVQSNALKTIFSAECKSWYGKVAVPWPGTHLHYAQATKVVRWEDYDLTFEDPEQRYASFGNGISSDGITSENIPWLHAS